ncbi:DNA-directed RNA polymerase subunit beta' [Castilleja foliolosa]|uniref:DNA-directed RNA polymerase n=1 Tax=Castilleja foliolosa TaxID=1961234 RepID=A0ABD3E1M3_9LAMI
MKLDWSYLSHNLEWIMNNSLFARFLSPAIGDPISVPTQDMLIGLYVLTSGNRRGICVNRYGFY